MAKFNEMSKEQHREIASKGGRMPKMRPQLTQTHCKRGHEMTAENTSWVKSHRKHATGEPYIYKFKTCKTCQAINRQTYKARTAQRKAPDVPAQRCSRGHELAVTGVSQAFKDRYISVNGVAIAYTYRRCLACRRENYSKRAIKKNA